MPDCYVGVVVRACHLTAMLLQNRSKQHLRQHKCCVATSLLEGCLTGTMSVPKGTIGDWIKRTVVATQHILQINKSLPPRVSEFCTLSMRGYRWRQSNCVRAWPYASSRRWGTFSPYLSLWLVRQIAHLKMLWHMLCINFHNYEHFSAK